MKGTAIQEIGGGVLRFEKTLMKRAIDADVHFAFDIASEERIEIWVSVISASKGAQIFVIGVLLDSKSNQPLEIRSESSHGLSWEGGI